MRRFFLFTLVASLSVFLSGCSLLPTDSPPTPTPSGANQTSDQPTPDGEELLKYSSMTIPETNIVVGWVGKGNTVEYQDGPMRGTATQLPQFTQKTADGTYVAYVVINNGGSGDLFYLATFQAGETNFENRDSVFLGDRIDVQSLSVNQQTAISNYLEHTPDQAMVEAPTQAVSRTFEVTAQGKLIEDTQAKTSQSNSQLANPASTNCIAKGGELSIQTDPNEGDYGVCTFEDNRQCEEWALMRGECPVGGIKVTGYDPNSPEYFCAIRGGKMQKTASNTTDCILP